MMARQQAFDSFSNIPQGDSLKQNAFSSFYSHLHPVDESPDFHDPYSALSLFLSHKIKSEMDEGLQIPQWTIKIQEELLRKITPEFQKKFPQYRLGVTAVKKIWEKILFYTQQIQGKTEAINSDGKLNINFFIKENLKQYLQHKVASFMHPHQFAHQVAAKMSECIATLEGTMPKVEILTQTIWALQKHLINTCQVGKAPYEEFDKIDKLIVKTILETTAKHPYIAMEELELKTKESLQALHDIPDLSSTAKITCNVSAILAEKLYATSALHILFFAEQKESINKFIKKHAALYRNTITASELPELVRRITALYTLACSLPKDLSRQTFNLAIQASFYGNIERPDLPQSVYAFIFAELWLIKGMHPDYNFEEIESIVFESYQNTACLPCLEGKKKDFLEIMIWKTLSETEGFLEKLPYRIGQKIEEEIAGILINDPTKSFSGIVHETVHFFEKVKELTESKKWKDCDKKIRLWCLQNDMLCRCIKLDLNSPLAKIIKQRKQNQGDIVCHCTFISQVCQDFLQQFPEMTLYMGQLNSKAWTLYKHLWFTSFSHYNESSFERFLQWHICHLQTKTIDPETLLQKLEEICKRSLPLVPFDKNQAQSIYESLIEKKTAP